MAKVAICFGVHNSDYLKPMLESIANQTYKDFKVYAWLDGCTDDSKQLLVDSGLPVKYEDAPACHVIGTVKHNVVEMALKDDPAYIQMLDKDDILEPTFLEKMVGRIEEGYDFVACDGVMFGERNGPIQSILWPHDVRKSKIIYSNPLLSWIMLRADVAREFNYREGLVHFEDWDLHLRLMMGDKDYSVVKEPLYNYRTHPEQFSKVTEQDFHRHRQEMWELNNIS